MRCYLVEARYYLKKGTRCEFYRKFRDNNIREFSQSEEGNIEYELYLPLDSDDDVCLIEKWDQKEHIEAHHKTLHYAILNELKEKYVKKSKITTYLMDEV